ncbi:unnamed protein product [Polarella glacialis]|uniref:Uncharacterized protein n=1 Tax=Polarella glacialis TaxID=89957 RepID=A0A813KPU7_POLGL|nr:unnamed protein product [Polarella glacialis]
MELEQPSWKYGGWLKGSADRRSMQQASQHRRLGDVDEVLPGEEGHTIPAMACPRQMSHKFMYVDPRNVHFTHPEVAPLFSCARDVRKVAQQMQENPTAAFGLPPLIVVHYKGRLWSRSNRRLQCYNLAGLHQAKAWLIEMHDFHLEEQVWVKCSLPRSWFETDHLSAGFFPYSDCTECGDRMLNRSALKEHLHHCRQ